MDNLLEWPSPEGHFLFMQLLRDTSGQNHLELILPVQISRHYFSYFWIPITSQPINP